MAARWEETKAARAGMVRTRRAPNGPRLQLASREGNQQIYDVLLDPADDWCISTHKVFGVPTAVGTSFLGLLAEFMALDESVRDLALILLKHSAPDVPARARIGLYSLRIANEAFVALA